ncbi:MAG: N-acetyl-gamma-glutamyl-phosphate reductase, partial [Allobaculum sp.]
KPYALGLAHKHIPEMKAVCGLQQTPLFVPIVDDYEKGMLTQVFLGKDDLTKSVSLQELLDLYKNWYSDSQIQVGDPQGALFSNTLAGKDGMEIFVNGSLETGYVLSARFDNLGKGASGAAVQNMNLMLGLDEYKGLHL